MLRILSRAAPTGLGQCGTTTGARCTSAGYCKRALLDTLYGLPPAVRMRTNMQRRAFGGIPTVLVPPVVFGGLLIGLWTWKCVMMVVFQNKIIYMPGLPPNTRWEKIEDYRNQCQGIQWREERTSAADGTQISLCVASVNCGMDAVSPVKTVYILYFQGNASSIPPRLPFLSPVLRMLRDRSTLPVRYTMICCSYRGYWTSKGRPTEKGIAMDAQAALSWIREYHDTEFPGLSDEHVPIVIWGQSIGAGVATSLAAQQQLFAKSKLLLKKLILETPFLSVRAMLETLYPQRWLPYKHLWPFLRNHLDSSAALGLMQQNFTEAGSKAPSVLIVEAGRDELVPKEHGDALERRCLELGLDVRKEIIGSAYHTEVLARPGGRTALVKAIENVVVK